MLVLKSITTNPSKVRVVEERESSEMRIGLGDSWKNRPLMSLWSLEDVLSVRGRLVTLSRKDSSM